MVKYDTVIELPNEEGLKPEMVAWWTSFSRITKIKVPVAAIETESGFVCWVKSAGGKRAIQLDDTNDEYTIVTDGLSEGEEVILDPTSFIDAAREEARKAKSESEAEAAMDSTSALVTEATEQSEVAEPKKDASP